MLDRQQATLNFYADAPQRKAGGTVRSVVWRRRLLAVARGHALVEGTHARRKQTDLLPEFEERLLLLGVRLIQGVQRITLERQFSLQRLQRRLPVILGFLPVRHCLTCTPASGAP